MQGFRVCYFMLTVEAVVSEEFLGDEFHHICVMQIFHPCFEYV